MATSTIKNMFNVETITIAKGSLECAETAVCNVKKYGRVVTVSINGSFNATSVGYGTIFTGLPKPYVVPSEYFWHGSNRFPMRVSLNGELEKASDNATEAGYFMGTLTYLTSD